MVATANMVATEQGVTVGTPIMAATEQGANNAVDTSQIAIEDTNAGGGAASFEEELKPDDEPGLEACARDDDEPGLAEFDRDDFMEVFRAENLFGPVDVDDVNIGDESFLCSAESDDEDSVFDGHEIDEEEYVDDVESDPEFEDATQAKDPKKSVETLEDIVDKLERQKSIQKHEILHPEPPTPELEPYADSANPAVTDQEATVETTNPAATEEEATVATANMTATEEAMVATANMVATEQGVTVGTPIMAATEQGANNAVDTSQIAIEDTNAGGGAASFEEELKPDDEPGLEACARDDDEPGLAEFDRDDFMEVFRAENLFGPVDVDDVNIGDESFLCSAESDDEDSVFDGHEIDEEEYVDDVESDPEFEDASQRFC
ncbi:hypothetical protein PInf_010296 [Phytophthora infestans]|nr:hypothetical protein PInf_010296 [Phytophthora infestans]